jgi:peptidoglycan/xylan/chitin deacetylase (PgdA/CDA1 family)
VPGPAPAVAVIARPAADLGACLAALERAGAEAPAIQRIGPDGPAMARNRALAACDSGVLALVEDDVAVNSGWLEALAAAWADGEDALACVGGPLRASFPEGRPEWVSEDLLDAFATLDLGDERAHVDARERTFHGGNVSFRTSALRAVGGFWPARGHPDGRDWFSEEHEAQRELARAGWRAAYVPEAAAERIVDRDGRSRVVLRRRLRYGARRALIGSRVPARAAARQLATSAAGVPVALARRQTQVAMERAVRAAESAGALLGPRLAHADLQPVARETPFRGSVPPAQQRRKRRPRGLRSRGQAGPVILLYHRVVEREADPMGVCVSPGNFLQQLEVLKTSRELVPLAEIVSGDSPPRAAAVTFDDGYRDNLEHAAPALADARVPAMLFVATGAIAEGQGFWWDELERVLRAAPADAESSLALELAGQRREFRVGSEHERRIARRHLHGWLQPMPPEDVGSALSAVRGWAGLSDEDGTPEIDRAMTPEELRAFAGIAGLAVGAHTRTHRSLRHADPATQEAEISGSRADIAAWLGTEPSCFSYPFGVPGADFDDEVVARVRAAGFTLGVTTRPGAVQGADRFKLPRSVVPDVDGEEFEAWLLRQPDLSRAAPAASPASRAA